MKKIFCLLIICTLTALFLQGCTMFTRPTGVWTCGELGITLNFDEDNGKIIIDGVSQEIVCFLHISGGGVDICYPKEGGYHSLEDECLYSGYFKNRGKDKMILVIPKPEDHPLRPARERYVFIKELESN